MAKLIIDIAGKTPTETELKRLAHPLVAGVILFSRNIENAEQVAELSAILRANVAKPLLLCVDQEGGRVQRLREGFTALPAMQAFSALLPEQAQARWAFEAGWQMAMDVASVGLDLSFAPVLDIGHHCPAIGDRSFGADSATVTRLARAFLQGMQSAGMATTGKHFPGHGAVCADSHKETPMDFRDEKALWDEAILPFASLIKEDLLNAIMPAHVIYPAVDDKPACGSSRWLKDVLRQRLQFKGMIFSDDLAMQGAAVMGDEWQRCQQAANAGCDLLLLCNDGEAVQRVLDQFDRRSEYFPENDHIWQGLRFQGEVLPQHELLQNPRYQANKAFLENLRQQWIEHKTQGVDPTENSTQGRA